MSVNFISAAITSLCKELIFYNDDCGIMLINAYVSSPADCCNSFPFDFTAQVILKLQAAVNAAARLVIGLQRFDYII